VTGAGGFVGRHVTSRALSAGWDVHVVDGDLSDESTADRALAAVRPAAVIHLAAPSGSTAMDPWKALNVEMAMMGCLLRAVRERSPRATVLAVGSAAQYGAGLNRPLIEDDPAEPLSAYGARKSVLERAFKSSSLTAGVRTVWCRSFNHAGPGQRADAPVGSWSRQLVAADRAGGGTIRTGRLTVVRDILDVRDIADAYLALVAVPDVSGVFNVCSGRPVTLSRVAELVLNEASSPVTLEYDPELERAVDPPYIVGNPLRLRQLTGWEPHIPLEQTIQDAVVAVRACQDAAPTDPRGARATS
jgi:GDP-4-dehydro-6-deoxy-D-mannose reductase